MPYRAMIWTIVTVSLALMAVTLWINAVEPMFAQIQSQQPTTTLAAATTLTAHPDALDPPDKKLKGLIKGIVYLSFILICFLLVVGVAASFREWIRFNTTSRKKTKTRYTDAWKIAGERLEIEPQNPHADDDSTEED